MRLRALLIVLAVLLAAHGAGAHPAVSTIALVSVDEHAKLTITITFDALAFALDDTSQAIPDPPMFALLDSHEQEQRVLFESARQRLQSLLIIHVGGQPVAVDITHFPAVDDLVEWKRMHPERRLPVRLDAQVRAVLPEGARGIVIRFPDILGDMLVTLQLPGAEALPFPVRAGESMPPFDLPGAARAEPALSTPQVFARYLGLGYTHIIPRGLDHVLFVLGLFFLSPRLSALLWQVTAFTLAHSLTLGLAMFHVVALSPRIVEPAIALSIVAVAVENLATSRVHPWRPILVFCFGLVHGLGFAGVLDELGLPTGQRAMAVAAFNVGVEGGQLTVIAAALAAFGWFRAKPWYRRRIAIPASLAIAAVAMVWTVQRLM